MGGLAPTAAARSVARKPSERIDAGGLATRSNAMLRGDGRRGIEDDRGAGPEGLAARPHLRADLERPALEGECLLTFYKGLLLTK
jgi:hypothetical protein